jgi:hypothetical protein
MEQPHSIVGAAAGFLQERHRPSLAPSRYKEVRNWLVSGCGYLKQNEDN